MKNTTQKAINAALAKYKADIIKQLTEAAPKAHIAGDLAALNKLRPIAVDFTLVQAEALKYSKDYSKLLYTKGGSMINGKFVPWVKDLTAHKRENIAKIISEGLKAGKPTTAIGGKALGKGTIAYDLAKECSGKGDAWAAMVARTETARIQGHGAMDRYKEQEIEEVKYLCGPDPCPICAANCQKVFKIGNAPEQPLHPRCVCDYAPVVSREKREELKEKAESPQITKADKFAIKTDIPQTKKDLLPYDVYGNQLGRNNNITFTEAEKYASERYKASDYLSINSHLRGTTSKHAFVPLENVDDVIKNLDSAIDKSVLPRDVNVFRGISPNTAKKLMTDNTCVDLGYSSTTYDPNTALTFTKEASGKFTNIMTFKYKKGTKALMWEHEEEVLGARGLKLKCIEIKEVKKVKGMLRSNKDIEIDNVRLFVMEVQ